MDEAMALDPAQPREKRTDQTDAEMALSAVAKTRVTAMAFAFVYNFNCFRLKLRKSGPHLFGYHPDPPFMWREIA